MEHSHNFKGAGGLKISLQLWGGGGNVEINKKKFQKWSKIGQKHLF